MTLFVAITTIMLFMVFYTKVLGGEEGELTIVYHHYDPTVEKMPEPVEDGGGIKAYCWILYPSAAVDQVRKLRKESAAKPDDGLPPPVILLGGGYQLQGKPDDKDKVMEALKDGRTVACGLGSPAAVTLTVPAGTYYLDCWLSLRSQPRWSKTNQIAPRTVGKGHKDWAPCKVVVRPGSREKSDVAPNGDNIESYFGNPEIILNMIDYGDRLGP